MEQSLSAAWRTFPRYPDQIEAVDR